MKESRKVTDNKEKESPFNKAVQIRRLRGDVLGITRRSTRSGDSDRKGIITNQNYCRQVAWF